MNATESAFYLSDNEQIVRNYECTKRLRLLGPAVIGYLTITNRRIVYHSQAKSLTGSSAVISEVALDDYSGLSTSISTSFNWILFLMFCALMYFATFLLFTVAPRVLTGWYVSILLLMPYLFSLLFERNILSREFQQQFLRGINEIPGSAFLRKKDRAYYMGIFRLLFWSGLALAAWNMVNGLGLVPFSFLTLILLGAVYYLIYRAIFGRVQSFNLSIASRAPKDTGITIPGNPLGLFLGGDAALQSLYSGPGRDAPRIVSEIGALLTDIRQLGDLGVQKWRNIE